MRPPVAPQQATVRRSAGRGQEQRASPASPADPRLLDASAGATRATSPFGVHTRLAQLRLAEGGAMEPHRTSRGREEAAAAPGVRKRKPGEAVSGGCRTPPVGRHGAGKRRRSLSEVPSDAFLDGARVEMAVRQACTEVMSSKDGVTPALMRKMRSSVAALGYAMRHPDSKQSICADARRLAQTARMHRVTPHSPDTPCFACRVWKVITAAIHIVLAECRPGRIAGFAPKTAGPLCLPVRTVAVTVPLDPPPAAVARIVPAAQGNASPTSAADVHAGASEGLANVQLGALLKSGSTGRKRAYSEGPAALNLAASAIAASALVDLQQRH